MKIASVSSSTLSYNDGGLNASTAYSYDVVAVNRCGLKSSPATLSITTLATVTNPPNAPSGLSASAVSSGQINLAWTNNSANQNGVYVQRSSDGANYAQIASLAGTSTAYSDSGLSASTLYYYRVQSYNSAGASTYSNVASATTLSNNLVSAFYVSPSGNDGNPGTLAAPFATLARAQKAMQASSTIKTTYVRKGTYKPATVSNCDGDGGTCGLNLGPADKGETWSYYPPDGINSAFITGQSTGIGTGLLWVLYVGDVSDVTIDGLAVQNFQYGGIGSTGGVNNLTVKNNLIFNGFNVSNGNPGGFTCYGCANTTISHNIIHDIAAFGISFGNVNGDISNMLVTGNYIYNTCTATSDCGAIYVVDGHASATNIRWTNNYVHDGNLAASLHAGGGGGSALYADDCSSNITMSGNIITGRNGANTIHIHGGSNIQILGNLTDLASYQMAAAVFQTSDGAACNDYGPMSGNKYESNIVISAGGGGGFWLLSGTPTNAPSIRNNMYHNYAGAAIFTGGDYVDANPVAADPLISGWTYTLSSSSPAYYSPVYFPGIEGGWGPPGFTVPHTGTAPSCPL